MRLFPAHHSCILCKEIKIRLETKFNQYLTVCREDFRLFKAIHPSYHQARLSDLFRFALLHENCDICITRKEILHADYEYYFSNNIIETCEECGEAIDNMIQSQ